MSEFNTILCGILFNKQLIEDYVRENLQMQMRYINQLHIISTCYKVMKGHAPTHRHMRVRTHNRTHTCTPASTLEHTHTHTCMLSHINKQTHTLRHGLFYCA
jgi:hypothetical protein